MHCSLASPAPNYPGILGISRDISETLHGVYKPIHGHAIYRASGLAFPQVVGCGGSIVL